MATLSGRLDDLEKRDRGPSVSGELSPQTLALLAELHEIRRTPGLSPDVPDLDPIESARLSKELDELLERKWAEGRAWRQR